MLLEIAARPSVTGLAAHGRRFSRFVTVGLSGVVVNNGVLLLLVELARAPHLLGAAAGAEVSIVTNFALHERWTFRESAQKGSLVGRAMRYQAVALSAALITLTLFAILTLSVGVEYLLANLAAIGAGTIWNYLLSSRFAWSGTRSVLTTGQAVSTAGSVEVPARPASLTSGKGTVVLLPTYNERDNIVPLVERLRSHLPQASIWILDDNSPDGTGELADGLARRDPLVEVIHRPEKLGLGAAYLDGFRRVLAADFNYVLHMDVDFSHDPSYVPAMLEAIADADVVIGSRYTAGGGTRNWPLQRRVLSRVGNAVARHTLGLKTRDTTGAFRLFRRTALEGLDLGEIRLRGYGFLIDMLFQTERRGLCVREVPITFVDRVVGSSKMSRAIVLEALMHIAKRRCQLVMAGLRRPVVAGLAPITPAYALQQGPDTSPRVK